MEVQFKDGKSQIFAPLKNKWLLNTPEESVRQEYICKLVESYGFRLEQMAQGVSIGNAQRGQGRASADILIWKSAEEKSENKSPIIVVECKAENITIREEDYFQGKNYVSLSEADFFVTSNLKETLIFAVVKDKSPKLLQQIVDIPDVQSITNNKKMESFLNQTTDFTREAFSKKLLKCHMQVLYMKS